MLRAWEMDSGACRRGQGSPRPAWRNSSSPCSTQEVRPYLPLAEKETSGSWALQQLLRFLSLGMGWWGPGEALLLQQEVWGLDVSFAGTPSPLMEGSRQNAPMDGAEPRGILRNLEGVCVCVCVRDRGPVVPGMEGKPESDRHDLALPVAWGKPQSHLWEEDEDTGGAASCAGGLKARDTPS